VPSILIIDDEETLAKNAARYLERAGHAVVCANDLRAGWLLYEQHKPDAIVLDYRLPDGTGVDFIRRVRANDSRVRILLITGHGSIELAVEAMKVGANDLLTKPLALAELRDRLASLAQAERDAGRLRYFEARERQATQYILGDSPPIEALRQRLARIASVDAEGVLPPVLITGETGSGKELVARACHFGGPRASGPFIEINCAAIPSQLLESELFGHERGAFTDARERKVGLLEAADGGSLFLDEVAEMDLALQAKLLKVIEDGRLRRVGAVQEQRVQVRIIAATHQDLEARVASGGFRADLYFRLKVLTLRVPALRERGDDILLLARHFTGQFSQRYRREGLGLSPAAERLITAHHWPGNVRELRNLIEQAVLLSPGPQIETADLMLPGVIAEPETDEGGDDAPANGSSLDRMEREALQRALSESGQNVSQAARALGISRDTLRYRMEKHGLRA
jgi:DNA-binding NtrC family response regulator